MILQKNAIYGLKLMSPEKSKKKQDIDPANHFKYR